MTPVDRRRILLLTVVLVAAVFAVYGQVVRHDFVDFDDLDYIVANPHVNTGLSLANLGWAFTSAHSNNWHPLTWISHMVDVTLFGLHPAGHHLMNVFFHALNGVLLLWLLHRFSGALWPSAFVAAFFVLHPLRVESVAWAAERKDVLSALFWMATLWLYVRYTEQPGWRRYALALGTFALGLLSKQMLVTLPFVLLLFDYWPLGRLFPATKTSPAPVVSTGRSDREGPPGSRGKGRRPSQARSVNASSPPVSLSPGRLVLEKVPFFVLSVLASVTVFWVQRRSGVLYGLDPFPLSARIGNALTSYTAYLEKMAWPVNLSVFYPHPLSGLGWGETLWAFAVLAAVTALCWRFRDRRYLTVGWCWYLGTLVPVIGLVQVGVQSMADRYTYLPLIGPAVMIAWGARDLLTSRPYGKAILAAGAGLILILCACRTADQVGVWKNPETLYTSAAAAVPDNWWAYNNLGAVLASSGRMDEASRWFARSLALMPDYPGANKNMAAILYREGRYEEALPYIEKALRREPRNPDYHVTLGLILLKSGRRPEARSSFQEALRIDPTYRDAREALDLFY